MILSENAVRLLLDDGRWTAERLARLAEEVGSADEARRLVAYWNGVEAALRHRVGGLVPDRSVLVLAGLERAGKSGMMTREERNRLESHRDSLDAAERESPAISDAIRSVGSDAAAFDIAWSDHFGTTRRGGDRPAVRRMRPPVRRVVARFAMAASIVAFVAVAVFLAQRDRGVTSVVATGDIRTINLADGSSVRLLSGAELTFDGKSFDRRVALSGKGYFDVRHDDEPFRVLTPAATVTVLGTKFGVDASAEETHVMLVDGRVAVSPPDAPNALVVLEPGQRTRVVRGESPSMPASANPQSVLDWTRLLFFRSTPLAEAAERIGTAFDVRVEVDDAIASEPVTGTFAPDDGLSRILGSIAAAGGWRLDDTTPGTLRIVPR